MKHPDQILAASRSSFAQAFVGLGADQKRAMTAVYAYARVLDDVVDERSSVQQAQEDLAAWQDILDQKFEGDSKLLLELSWAVNKFDLEMSDFQWLHDGVSMDLTCVRYDTWEHLLQYCDGVATSVGKLCLAIFGVDREKSHPYAVSTARALQLTNICRDVYADAKIGRIYLPKECLVLHGLQEQDILEGQWNAKVMSALLEVIEQANTWYLRSDDAAEDLPAGKIWPAQAMKEIYRATLMKIQKKPRNIIQGKVRISNLKKIWIAKSAFAQAKK